MKNSMRDKTDNLKSLRSLHNYYQKIISCMPNNVYWLDRDCIAQGCNNNVLKLLHLKSLDEFIGINYKTMGELGNWTKGQAESFEHDDKEVMATGIAKYNVEEPPVYDENGNPRYYMSSRVPIYNDDNEVIGVVGISVDITEHKESEKNLIIAKEQAEAANEAKESFLRNMRHDLRTPFSGILTLSEWMATQEADPNKKENLECIAQSAQVLLDYMNTVLEQARQGVQSLTIEKKPFDLEKSIKDALLTIKPVTINKGLQLTMHYPNTIPKHVQGDVACLQRIIINLLGNAVKFTHSGEIHVDVALVKQQAEKITLAISVSDTGIGIPSEKHEEIFEKFTRLEAAYEGKYTGMGLGLHDVKELCQQLGGEVFVTANGEQGSVFTCTLPFVLSDVPISSQNTDTENHSAFTTFVGFKVLLVEDQPIAAHAAATVLRSHGYEVDIAPSGYIALEKFTDQKYDLVLLDIGLPDMSGFTLAKQFRKLETVNQQPITPLFALTAHERIEDPDFDVFDRILNKPFSVTALKELRKFMKR